jgi:hypothetical protein
MLPGLSFFCLVRNGGDFPEGCETVTIALDAEHKVSIQLENLSRRAGNQLVFRYESEPVDIDASVGVECRCRSIGHTTNQCRSKTD